MAIRSEGVIDRAKHDTITAYFGKGACAVFWIYQEHENGDERDFRRTPHLYSNVYSRSSWLGTGGLLTFFSRFSGDRDSCKAR